MAAKKKKSSARMLKFLPKDAELFKDVVYLVEATHHEQFVFWQDFYDKPKYDGARVKNWEQEMSGQGLTIGYIDDRPVTLTIFWAWLDGFKVMFYDSESQVTDWAMVEKWINHFSKDIKCDNGYRQARTDSGNFAHCIHAIQEFTEKKDPRYNPNKLGRNPR